MDVGLFALFACAGSACVAEIGCLQYAIWPLGRRHCPPKACRRRSAQMMNWSEHSMLQNETPHASAPERPVLQRLKVQAKRHGFTCVSTQWQGNDASYDFVCPEGHALQRTAGSLLYGWPQAPCPGCVRAAAYRRLKILAGWQGDACLEGEFLGARVNHSMRCAEGHEWQADGRKLLQVTGVPFVQQMRVQPDKAHRPPPENGQPHQHDACLVKRCPTQPSRPMARSTRPRKPYRRRTITGLTGHTQPWLIEATFSAPFAAGWRVRSHG